MRSLLSLAMAVAGLSLMHDVRTVKTPVKAPARRAAMDPYFVGYKGGYLKRPRSSHKQNLRRILKVNARRARK